MSQIERIYGIHRLLRKGRKPSLQTLMEKFEASKATIKRDLDYMRDRLGAPVLYERAAGGYAYVELPGLEPYELPGLWFSADEVQALLLMHELLGQLQSGVLREPLKPLEQKLKKLLDEMPGATKDLRKRFLLLSSATRDVPPRHFSTVATATLERRKLEMRYFAKAKAERKQRQVSPQRLIYYKSNWYVHAWCHTRNDLRSFALDSIEHLKMLEEPAQEVDAATVEAHIGQGYGIFSGPIKAKAVLEFTSEAARWVRKERWHPEQLLEETFDGGVRLTVPVTHWKEIVMDVMRYGPEVVVQSPAALRAEVARLHTAAAARYRGVRIGPGSAAKISEIPPASSAGEPLRGGY